MGLIMSAHARWMISAAETHAQGNPRGWEGAEDNVVSNKQNLEISCAMVLMKT